MGNAQSEIAGNHAIMSGNIEGGVPLRPGESEGWNIDVLDFSSTSGIGLESIRHGSYVQALKVSKEEY